MMVLYKKNLISKKLQDKWIFSGIDKSMSI